MTDGIITPFVDEYFWQNNITQWVQLDMRTSSRMLVSGPSGSGKTTLCLGLLSKTSRHLKNCQIFLLDYKNVDFAFLKGAKHFFKYDDCLEGFTQFYNIFEERLSHNDTYNWLILYIDEYPSWLLSFSSKEQKEIMSKMARLLNLSRAKQIHIIVSAQKPLSELFSTGSRESFSHKILLQAPSRETVNMLMPNFKEEIETCPTGVGYYTVNDDKLTKIRVPFPRNIKAMHDDLWSAVNR